VIEIDPPAVVPESATPVALSLAGLAIIGIAIRRKRVRPHERCLTG
jgi:hypothetical protein